MTAVDFAVVVWLKRDSSIINTASRYEPETVYNFGHTGPVSVPAIYIYIYTVLVASSAPVGMWDRTRESVRVGDSSVSSRFRRK